MIPVRMHLAMFSGPSTASLICRILETLQYHAGRVLMSSATTLGAGLVSLASLLNMFPNRRELQFICKDNTAIFSPSYI